MSGQDIGKEDEVRFGWAADGVVGSKAACAKDEMRGDGQCMARRLAV